MVGQKGKPRLREAWRVDGLAIWTGKGGRQGGGLGEGWREGDGEGGQPVLGREGLWGRVGGKA